MGIHSILRLFAVSNVKQHRNTQHTFSCILFLFFWWLPFSHVCHVLFVSFVTKCHECHHHFRSFPTCSISIVKRRAAIHGSGFHVGSAVQQRAAGLHATPRGSIVQGCPAVTTWGGRNSLISSKAHDPRFLVEMKLTRLNLSWTIFSYTEFLQTKN